MVPLYKVEDLTEIICRGIMKATKEISKGTCTYQISILYIHVDIFVSLSGSVIILISSIESNMNTKYIKGNWKIIELISAWLYSLLALSVFLTGTKKDGFRFKRNKLSDEDDI